MKNETVKPPSLAKAQQTVREILGQLQQVDDQLAELSSVLPGPTAQFDVRAELRGAVECVRAELLLDAIETLGKTVAASSLELRLGFEMRQQLWLAREGGAE